MELRGSARTLQLTTRRFPAVCSHHQEAGASFNTVLNGRLPLMKELLQVLITSLIGQLETCLRWRGL